MTTPTAQRVQKHREGLRAAGMRPVQIWVPDTRREGFALECKRQARLLREAPLFRVRVEPGPGNNLQKTSEVMVDKAQSVLRERVGEAFGHLTEEQMLAVSRSQALFLGVL